MPTTGQVVTGLGGQRVSVFPLRAYNLIWNTWFRDENLQSSVTVNVSDGSDSVNDFVLLRRGKRHDYFTSCLPWPQKSSSSVGLSSASLTVKSQPLIATPWYSLSTLTNGFTVAHAGGDLGVNFTPTVGENMRLGWDDGSTSLYVNMGDVSINDLRTSFAIQTTLS